VEWAELVYYEANNESLIQEQRERMEELSTRQKNHSRKVAILKHDITITRQKRNVEFASKTENERHTKLDKIVRQSKERGDVKKCRWYSYL
jgi:phage shock protein A